MDEATRGNWSLEDLLGRITAEQARLGIVPADPRVADHPSVRTVRYYATLGILDRPLGYQGGSARYGPRHLLQYLAVKALQAEHMPLPEIQRRLFGLADSDLARVVEAGARSNPVEGSAPAVQPSAWLTTRPAPGLLLVTDNLLALRQWLYLSTPDEVAAALRGALDTLAGGASAADRPTHKEEPR